MLHGLPDLFCELYDGIDAAAFRREIETWTFDAALGSTSLDIEQQARAGTLTARSVRLRMENGRDREAIRFACLRGLDQAFMHVNPSAPMSSACPPALAPLAVRCASCYRLDSGAQGGALIPRLVTTGRSGQLPDDPREAFVAVLRVPPAAWDACELRVLPERALMHRHELAAGLRMGCVPFMADPDELAFETDSRGGLRFYNIRPRGLATTRKRIEHVLDAMVAAEIRVGVVPELMLAPDLLDCWQAALRARRGDVGKLQWLLAGSGNLNQNGARPSNAAVLLDARSGDELARQRKLYPFNFSQKELELWKLGSRLGGDPIDEDLDPGERLLLLEGGGVRVAILVCEDLGRVVDLGRHLRDFGVSHALVPVFARPTQDHRWERSSANVHCRATGSTFVVANSRVMHTVLERDGGTGLVVWPDDALVLESKSECDVACFDLQPDGSAKAV